MENEEEKRQRRLEQKRARNKKYYHSGKGKALQKTERYKQKALEF